jgi:ubiquinone/menaquinone biosynthesis C-methylase UbiE
MSEMNSTAKAYKGMGMEGSVARWYDRTTRKDMPQFRELATKIASMTLPNAEVLEIAPGPGFLAIEMARRGLRVRAVEISKTFVEIGRRNARAEGVDVRFQQGNAAELPVKDGSVNFVVCRAAFKNFTEPVKALAEMKRVLVPGGIALIIDMRRDVNLDELRQYVHNLGVNMVNRWFMMLVFRFMLIRRAYPIDEIRRMAKQAGWAEPRIESSPVGFEAWMTK